MAAEPGGWITLGRRVLAVAAIATGLGAGTAPAEIYQYVDPDGTIHLSNVPTDSRFRRIDPERLHVPGRLSAEEIERLVAWYASRHDLEPALLRAVMKAESDFDPRAVSKAGAIGLMQLMPTTAEALRVYDPYNPMENVSGGARYLRYLLDRFDGDLRLALAAYNAGESIVSRHRQVPPIDETRRYVTKVLRFYRSYRTYRTEPPPLPPESPSGPTP